MFLKGCAAEDGLKKFKMYIGRKDCIVLLGDGMKINVCDMHVCL
jgi:hypothetical protein